MQLSQVLKRRTCHTLAVTTIFAAIFRCLQGFEYISALFSMSYSVYGSVFYMATGFHRFHVTIGTIFLVIYTFRLYLNHFSRQRHFGFEAAAWCWHFADVVWLFLYSSIYWWGFNVLIKKYVLRFG